MIDLELTSISDTRIVGGGHMDIDYDHVGNPKLVEGTLWLNQNIQKWLMTQLRSTNLFPDYGSKLYNLTGQRFGDSIIRSYLINAIVEAINNYLIQQQVQQSVVTMTTEELLNRLKNVTVTQDTVILTKYNIMLYLLTQAGAQQINLSVQL